MTSVSAELPRPPLPRLETIPRPRLLVSRVEISLSPRGVLTSRLRNRGLTSISSIRTCCQLGQRRRSPVVWSIEDPPLVGRDAQSAPLILRVSHRLARSRSRSVLHYYTKVQTSIETKISAAAKRSSRPFIRCACLANSAGTRIFHE